MNRVNKILQNELFRLHIRELKELERERIFCGHGMEHLLSVARIMRIKAFEQGLKTDPELIYAAALLHDIGRGVAYRIGSDHAVESTKIARRILEECDFGEEECEQILFSVLHHNDLTVPDELCGLLREADKLSRNCFDCSAYDECNWSLERKNKGISV